MDTSLGISKSIKAGISFALSILIWMFLAPPELGGSTRYAMVVGKSMLPTLHAGDLVMLRIAADYQVGDIVGFTDPNVHAAIVHRIVTNVNGQFITKGDNNADLDSYMPTRDKILGKVWLRAPALGNLVAILKRPIIFTSVVGLMVLFLILTFNKPSSQDQDKREINLNTINQTATTEKAKVSNVFPRATESLLVILVVAFVLSLGFVIWSFSKPVYQKVEPISYEQTGKFTYTASAIPGIYDSDSAKTGDPVFTQLTCMLNVTFDYLIRAEGLGNVSGTYQTYAKVYDPKSGWTKTIPLTIATSFTGETINTTSTVDLCQIKTMIETTEEKTGLHLGNYSMDIVAAVSVNGLVQGVALQDFMVSTLSFIFERLSVYVNIINSEIDPFSKVDQGTVESQELTFNSINVLGIPTRVVTVRYLSAAFLVLTGTFLGILLFEINKLLSTDIDKKIELQYGALVIDSSDFILKFAPVIEFETIDELARMAAYNHTAILRTKKPNMIFYTVRIGEISFRFISDKSNETLKK
jgi:signal peptidase